MQLTVHERDAAGTEFLSRYLARLKAEKRSVFYGECRLREGGKASIIFPTGIEAALYVEMTMEMTVANTAELSWRDGRWNTEVAQGGVYTIRRAENLIRELLDGSFRILLPEQLDMIRTSRSRRTCVQKGPE